MKGEIVRELEAAVELAIADALKRQPQKEVAAVNRHTVHLMAKAAVSVLEAVLDAPAHERRAES